MHAWLGANGSVKRDDIKHVAGKGRFPSCRLVLMAIGFFTYVNFHTLRIDLSVAIVAMVNSTHLRRVDTAAVLNISSQQSSLSDQHEQCGNDRDSNESRVTIDDDNVRLRIIVWCHILRLKCTKFDFGWGCSQRSTRSLPGFKGPYF